VVAALWVPTRDVPIDSSRAKVWSLSGSDYRASGHHLFRVTSHAAEHSFYLTHSAEFAWDRYTTFQYDLASAPSGIVSLDAVRDMLTATSQAGRIFPAHDLLSAAAPLVKYEINVTNTGNLDADDAVLGMLKPPGAGVNGVPLQQLYGFEKVHIKAGQTRTVQLYPSLADFTQVDADGVRHVHPGEYTFTFGVRETVTGGGGYTEHSVTTV
jgi:hypothetical protein